MGLISTAPAGMTNEPFPNISIPAPSPVQEGPRFRGGAVAIANAIGCGGKQSCLCELGCCLRWLMCPLAPVGALGGGAAALRHRAWQKQRTPGLTEKGRWPVLCLLQARPEVVSLIEVSQIYSFVEGEQRVDDVDATPRAPHAEELSNAAGIKRTSAHVLLFFTSVVKLKPA